MSSVFIRLNKLAASAASHSEVVAAFFVLAIIFMMIMPLPTLLVDTLISINICIAILLVVFAMYLPGPLAFSTFPGVLLLTTLFRLALSITTTRLILLQHDAGNIVQAFGDFVVGGDLVVGLVIFLILTIVQFVVITKGSERIAEVTARFSLDGMPGKQMSIDSDLRGGMIDALEAKRRRESLSRESQLYGAMDGAMKFVKGDAIAGLIIVAVNLLGGLAVGTMKHGMSVSEAVPVYSVLTIGDGLVAQIPALLISLTAGMIVTRVMTDTPDSQPNVGREMAQQILSQPKAWLIASGAMLIFSLIPGMPTMVFLSIAIITAAIGLAQIRSNTAKQVALEKQIVTDSDHQADIVDGQKDVRRFDPIKPYLLKLSSHDVNSNELTQSIRRSRNIIVSKLGMTLPSLELQFDESLKAGEYSFLVNEIPKLQGHYHYGYVLPSVTSDALKQRIIEHRENKITAENWDTIVKTETNTWWLPESAIPTLKQLNVAFESSALYLARRVEKVFLQTGAQFIGVQETHALLAWLESEQSELAKELQRSIPITKFSDVLQRLAAERVSLRSLRQIAEALIEWGHQERDAAILTEHVRTALRHQICHEHSKEGHIQALFIDATIEEALRVAMGSMQKGGYLALDPSISETLISGIASLLMDSELIKSLPCPVHTPPALIVPADIRRLVRKITENHYFQLPVLSFSEITPDLQIHSLGKIKHQSDDSKTASPGSDEKQSGEQNETSTTKTKNGESLAATG